MRPPCLASLICVGWCLRCAGCSRPAPASIPAALPRRMSIESHKHDCSVEYAYPHVCMKASANLVCLHRLWSYGDYGRFTRLALMSPGGHGRWGAGVHGARCARDRARGRTARGCRDRMRGDHLRAVVPTFPASQGAQGTRWKGSAECTERPHRRVCSKGTGLLLPLAILRSCARSRHDCPKYALASLHSASAPTRCYLSIAARYHSLGCGCGCTTHVKQTQAVRSRAGPGAS